MKLSVILFAAAAGALFLLLTRNNQRPKRKRPKPDRPSLAAGNTEPAKQSRQTRLTQDYFYLSLLDNWLVRYQLQTDQDDSFFSLLSRLKEEGKATAAIVLKQALAASDAKEAVLTAYHTLRSTASPLPGIAPANEHSSSPKIYRAGLLPNLQKFGLTDAASIDLRGTVFVLLSMAYNSGKEILLNQLEVNMTWLDKHLQAGQQEKAELEIEEIGKKLR